MVVRRSHMMRKRADAGRGGEAGSGSNEFRRDTPQGFGVRANYRISCKYSYEALFLCFQQSLWEL